MAASTLSFKERVVLESDRPRGSSGRTPVYHLRLNEVQQPSSSPFRLYEYGKPSDGIKRFEKVILMVGATGSGKTTLINSMINYIFGVEFEDKFRLKIISENTNKSQSQSQTSHISAYTLHYQDGLNILYTLTIIDTPGYGDTSGIHRDQEITKQMHDFFKSDKAVVDHIDAVGFVAQAALPRLTITQRYIFDSILSLFGKDIGENIFLLLTFADGQKPEILAAIQEAGIPHQAYFKFNNAAMFPDTASNAATDDSDDEDDFNQMFWKRGMKSFQKLMTVLEKIPTKSLTLTKEVLEKRKAIENCIETMNHKVGEGLDKLKQLNQEEQLFLKHKQDVENNKNFEYVVEETVEIVEKVDDHPVERFGKGVLTVCTFGLASFSPKLRRRHETRTKTKTLEEVKARYEEAQGKKLSVQQVIAAIKKEFEDIQRSVCFVMCEIRSNLKFLKQIVLKDNPLSAVDYIDLMIENEKRMCGCGWQERVEQLMTIRGKAEELTKIETESYDPFKEYADKFREEMNQGEEADEINPQEEKAATSSEDESEASPTMTGDHVFFRGLNLNQQLIKGCAQQ